MSATRTCLQSGGTSIPPRFRIDFVLNRTSTVPSGMAVQTKGVPAVAPSCRRISAGIVALPPAVIFERAISGMVLRRCNPLLAWAVPTSALRHETLTGDTRAANGCIRSEMEKRAAYKLAVNTHGVPSHTACRQDGLVSGGNIL
jgi:hypothetical protein